MGCDPGSILVLLEHRTDNIWGPEKEMLNKHTIRAHANMIEYPIQVQLQKEMLDGMISYAKQLVNLKGLLPGAFDTSKLLLPLVQSMDQPVYEHFDSVFREFTTPGYIPKIIVMVALGVSFVEERKDGILGRSLVAACSIHSHPAGTRTDPIWDHFLSGTLFY